MFTDETRHPTFQSSAIRVCVALKVLFHARTRPYKHSKVNKNISENDVELHTALIAPGSLAGRGLSGYATRNGSGERHHLTVTPIFALGLHQPRDISIATNTSEPSSLFGLLGKLFRTTVENSIMQFS